MTRAGEEPDGTFVTPDHSPRTQRSEPRDVLPRDLHHRRTPWIHEYVRRLAITDLLCLIVAIFAAEWLKFGLDADVTTTGGFTLSYTGLGIGLAIAWWGALTALHSREERILGEGPEEYRRVTRITVTLFGILAIASVMAKVDMSRGYLAIAFPLGLTLLLVNRKFWRARLQNGRQHGHFVNRVLVIGGIRSALHMTTMFDNGKASGMSVSGVWVPDRVGVMNEWLDVPGRFIPVMGTDRTLAGALTISDADTVVVTDTEHLGHDGLRELAWELEGVDVDLVVSPNVIDVAGPRIHVQAVANMPLIHLQEPRYAGANRFSKVAFDRIFSALAIVMLSPLLIATAITVKFTSPGPVLYRSTRVGVNSVPFEMLKFRSMVVDADRQLTALLDDNDATGPLFKMRDDPRVTRTGAFLRRYSLDELPQLINVLKGEMSLVGPRPPLPSEVDAYEGHASKRLLVRQGITGLWQVSGRSDLTWEEMVRLDLDYVENWSLARDLQIIWRTVKAVVKSEGAY